MASVCACSDTCLRVLKCTRTPVHAHTAHACKLTAPCADMYMYMYMCMYMHMYMHMHTQICICICICMCIHRYVYAYAYADMYMYMYTRVQANGAVCAHRVVPDVACALLLN